MEVLCKSAVDKVMLLVNKIKFQWQECETNCSRDRIECEECEDDPTEVPSDLTFTKNG